MGSGQSRKKAIAGSPQESRFTIGMNHPEPNSGYFILSLREDRIKVVNIDSPELKLLTMLINRHCKIVKEGWDRHLTYSYKLRTSGRHVMIKLVSDCLLSLYKCGWHPMAPIGALQGQNNQETQQATICFQKDMKEEEKSSSENCNPDDTSCLCLETYQDTFLGFHNVCNEILLELVTTIKERWIPGIRGVSTGVASVITDYCQDMPQVLTGYPAAQQEKFIRLEGRPWSFNAQEGKDLEDSLLAEQLQVSIVACLSKAGYKLGMDINMDTHSRVFFFIKSVDSNQAEVRVPNNAGAGLGEKDTMSVYRPLVRRHRSSFYRSYNGKTASLKKKIQASLRRKALARHYTHSCALSSRHQEWWQQSATDTSDYEDICSFEHEEIDEEDIKLVEETLQKE